MPGAVPLELAIMVYWLFALGFLHSNAVTRGLTQALRACRSMFVLTVSLRGLAVAIEATQPLPMALQTSAVIATGLLPSLAMFWYMFVAGGLLVLLLPFVYLRAKRERRSTADLVHAVATLWDRTPGRWYRRLFRAADELQQLMGAGARP